MALETGTYISDLNSANPANTDGVTQADDHLRLLKSTVKATFPNITGAVTPTHTELNFVDGVTSSIQTQLDAKAAKASSNTFTANQRIDAALGIGVAPSVAFDMAGEVLIRGAAAAGSLVRITPDATGSNGVIVDTSWITGGQGPLVFKMSSTERVRIDANGNVGVGTSTALGTYGKLRVGGAGYQALNVGSDDASGVNVVVAANSTTEGRIGTVTNHPVDIYTNNLARMRIDAAGAVTIGGNPVISASGTAAQGDVLYHNGTAWTRLAAGTSGQVLKTNGTGANPSWVTPTVGGVTLLGTMTLSTNSTPLSGLTLTSYKFVRFVLRGASVNVSSGANFSIGTAVVGVTTSSGGAIYGIADLDLATGMIVSNWANTLGVGELPRVNDSGYSTATTTIVASVSAGGFDSGTITVYGIA